MTPANNSAAAQPNQQFYPLSALDMFPSYDRAAYLAAKGAQAPTYDSTKPTKLWSDPAQNAADNVTQVSYGYYNGAARTMVTMSASEAATPNIPGVRTYPAYSVAPTDAAEVSTTVPGQTPAPINPATLSLQADALSLAIELGLPGSVLSDGSVNNQAVETVYPADEPRRQWVILFKGGQCYAGTLLAEKYAQGIGAPGSWNLAGPAPVWISSQPASDPPLNSGTLAPPQRALLPNEEIIATALNTYGVERTDLMPAPAAAAGGSALSADQAAALALIPGIYTLLEQIAAKV